MRKIFLAKTSCLLCLVALLPSCAGNNDAAESADGLVIPFVIEDGFMIMEATINGKAGRFVFDSGANVSVVPDARMSLPMLPAFVLPGGRPGFLLKYLVRRVEFANGSVRASSWVIRNAGGLGIPLGAEGILGNGIFAGYWVEISFSRNEIVLYRQFPERFAEALHSPLAVRAMNKFLLTIGINGREFLLALDTGLNQALFFPGVIAEGMDAADLRPVASTGEIKDFYLMRADSVSIMGRTYSDKLIMGNSYAGARVAANSHIGLMGTGFLRHYDLLLDYRTLQLSSTNDDSAGMFYIPIVAPEERDYGFYSFLDAAPEFGIIEAVRSQGHILIRSLLADSEAYALGLRPGSHIVRLDGRATMSFSPEEVSNPYFYDRFTEFEAIIDGAQTTLRRER